MKVQLKLRIYRQRQTCSDSKRALVVRRHPILGRLGDVVEWIDAQRGRAMNGAAEISKITFSNIHKDIDILTVSGVDLTKLSFFRFSNFRC